MSARKDRTMTTTIAEFYRYARKVGLEKEIVMLAVWAYLAML